MPEKDGQLPPTGDSGKEPSPKEVRIEGGSQGVIQPEGGTAAPEDYKKQLEDAQSELGRRSAEVGELRDRVTQYEEYLRQQAARVQPPPGGGYSPPVGEQTPSIPFNYENPMESITKVINTTLEQREKTQKDRVAPQYFRQGAQIINTEPERFKGIENDVARMMQGGYQTGLFKDPEDLRNPDNWRAAATLVRAKKSNWAMPNQVNPVSPVQTNLPSGYRPPQSGGGDEPVFNSNDREMLRAWGYTEQQAKEKMKEQAQKERG
ncbi:MAG: hypothetical protein ABIJ57_03300 [Pseudomonadota bacterium]